MSNEDPMLWCPWCKKQTQHSLMGIDLEGKPIPEGSWECAICDGGKLHNIHDVVDVDGPEQSNDYISAERMSEYLEILQSREIERLEDFYDIDDEQSDRELQAIAIVFSRVLQDILIDGGNYNHGVMSARDEIYNEVNEDE